MGNQKKHNDKKEANKSSSPYDELYGKKKEEVDQKIKGAGDFGSAANSPGPESKDAEDDQETDDK
ncbi:hypothetical protein D3C87_529110 [compost metagenome]